MLVHTAVTASVKKDSLFGEDYSKSYRKYDMDSHVNLHKIGMNLCKNIFLVLDICD